MTYENEGCTTGWQNQPTNPTSTEAMAYGGEGMRVAFTVNGGAPTYYLGQLEEVAGSTVTKYFSAGGSGLATAMRVGTGQSAPLYYLAADGLGSVSVALDASGNTVSQQLYGPSGSVRYSSGTDPTTKSFTGQRLDGASGLLYYNARYYDGAARAFTSADTVSDGLNRYAYLHRDVAADPRSRAALSDPATNADPQLRGHAVYVCVTKRSCKVVGAGLCWHIPSHT